MHRTRLALALPAVLLLAPLAGASHADGTYEQPLFFVWEEAVLDVLIIPPNHGQLVNGNGALNGLDPFEATPLNSYLAAIEEAVADWDLAVQQFGPAWLRNGLVTNVYVVGVDSIPPAALLDPEIVVYTDETKGPILGFAFSSRPCIVNNSKLYIQSFTYEDMYNVMGQEYGHCLGLGHVGGNHPAHDVMDGSYDDAPGAAGVHRHCVSNLNVRGLEQVFGELFGQPGGSAASIPVSQYQTIAC